MADLRNPITKIIKLDPTKKIMELFYQYSRTSDAVYNIGINMHEDHYKKCKEENLEDEYWYLSAESMSVKLNNLKNTDEKYFWLKNYNAECLKGSLRDLERAYNRYKDNPKKYGLPKYKRKKNSRRSSFVIRADRLTINENTVSISSIGKVKIKGDFDKSVIGYGGPKKYKPKMKHYKYYNARIICDGNNYYLKFTMEEDIDNDITTYSQKKYLYDEDWQKKPESDIIGIDIGCSRDNWIKTSKRDCLALPDNRKEKKKCKRLNKKLKRQIKVNIKNGNTTNSPKFHGEISNGILKTKKQIAKYNNKITNRNNTAICTFVSHNILSRKPKAIVVEDIKVKDMLKTDKSINKTYRRRHNSKILEHAPYKTVTKIKELADKNNIPVIVAPSSFASSQICSKCGQINDIGTDKIYKCNYCGHIENRDDNACNNLKQYGISITLATYYQ